MTGWLNFVCFHVLAAVNRAAVSTGVAPSRMLPGDAVCHGSCLPLCPYFPAHHELVSVSTCTWPHSSLDLATCWFLTWNPVLSPYSLHGILQTRILQGLLCPSPGHLPDPGIKPGSPAFQAASLLSEPLGKHKTLTCGGIYYMCHAMEEEEAAGPPHD